MIAEAMQPQELKNMGETGSYKPDPAQIANAMLSRRGVRELLVLQSAGSSPFGRTQPPAGFPRRAA